MKLELLEDGGGSERDCAKRGFLLGFVAKD